MSATRRRSGKTQEVRIIGGEWRGRKLDFKAADGLRPTGDRVRETLFNWLVGEIEGARCADLFTGTGALGLEALSRGASYCDFVDQSDAVIGRVSAHLATLGASSRGACHRTTAQQFIDSAREAYNLVFVDPPFSLDLGGEICAALERAQLLAENALVYLESDAHNPPPAVLDNWYLYRDKVAGAVAYRLYRVAL